MAPDPIIDTPTQKEVVLSTSLEKKTKKNDCLSKVLVLIVTLVSLGIITLVICASLALIPWIAAAIPIAIGLVVVALSLILLRKILKQERKPKILPSPITPLFKDLSSILLDQKLQNILFPTEEELSSLNPETWFSKERLAEAFSKKWIRISEAPDFNRHIYEDFVFMLTLQDGNISTFHTRPCSNELGAIVNAANTNISPGGGGINAALSEAVTRESWEASKEGRTLLNVSDVSAGKWISRGPVSDKNLEPSYLFQALGPKASETPNTFQAYRNLILTYTNCFKKADSLQVTYLQLPLLSSSDLETSERGWPIMTKLAFLAGVYLFLARQPDYLEEIFLIDPDRLPDFYYIKKNSNP